MRMTERKAPTTGPISYSPRFNVTGTGHECETDAELPVPPNETLDTIAMIYAAQFGRFFRKLAMSDAAGIQTIESRHGAEETLKRLEQILEAKGVKVFAVIDHSGEAEKAGLQMPNTKVVIFGNPKGGTPLMLAAPTIALDLPLKILISEDAEGRVWVSYNKPEFLQERHNLPVDLMPTLALAGALAEEIAR